ncbi:MAG: hypothetical protein NC307_11555 [Roseburia sp.]|nr:hypothetical protein [Roseburia sp.]
MARITRFIIGPAIPSAANASFPINLSAIIECESFNEAINEGSQPIFMEFFKQYAYLFAIVLIIFFAVLALTFAFAI